MINVSPDIRHVVIATKYTTNFMAGPPGEGRIVSDSITVSAHWYLTDMTKMANYTGNGTKSMHTSLKASLKKLNTDYIDLLYVHWWDFSASVSCTSEAPRFHHILVGGRFLCVEKRITSRG